MGSTLSKAIFSTAVISLQMMYSLHVSTRSLLACLVCKYFIFAPIFELAAIKQPNNSLYYMTSSASGQDEPNRALWLATRAGKMEPSCPIGTTRCVPHEKFPRKSYNKSFIDQACSVKMVGYWPRSFFASLWTETMSRSITTQKKNLANIQPYWPHTWSITHTHLP